MRPDRYWLSGSRMNVVDVWMGGAIALVLSSTQPSAWAAMLAGLSLSVTDLHGGDGRCRRSYRTRQAQGRGGEEEAPAAMLAQPSRELGQVPQLAQVNAVLEQAMLVQRQARPRHGGNLVLGKDELNGGVVG